MKAVRAGMWRGAKFGFFTFTIITVSLVVAGVIILLLNGSSRARLGQMTLLEVIKAIGGVALVPVFGILYGAIPGALIMGIATSIVWRRPQQTSNTNESGKSETWM
jgi:ribose/xylose/arabinose/galactoside ABC-type transport system permease subunit